MLRKKEKVGFVWKNTVDRHRCGGFFLSRVYLGCAQREKGVDYEAKQAKQNVFRRVTNSEMMQFFNLLIRSRRGGMTWKIMPKSAQHCSWRERYARMIVHIHQTTSTVHENVHPCTYACICQNLQTRLAFRSQSGTKRVAKDCRDWHVTWTVLNITDKYCFCCCWGTTKDCFLGWFQDASFAGDLQGSKILLSGRCVCSDHNHSSQFFWICKKQTAYYTAVLCQKHSFRHRLENRRCTGTTTVRFRFGNMFTRVLGDTLFVKIASVNQGFNLAITCHMIR